MKMLPRHQLLIIFGLVVALPFAFLIGARGSLFDFGQISGSTTQNTKEVVFAAAGSTEKFTFLSKQRSNSCGLRAEQVLSYSDEERLQGSCCSAMDLHRYQEQVKGLKKYSNISQIPPDPYDISISLAKELLGYKDLINLTTEQQKIYDNAMELSDEGGPCCCKCWRWDAFEGQAKYLITKYNFSAEEIAEIWDIEDGCGGEGHEHG